VADTLLAGSEPATMANALPQPPRRRRSVTSLVLFVLAIVLAALILYPMTRLVISAFFGDGVADSAGVVELFGGSEFWAAARNSALLVAVGAVVAVFVSAVLVWVNERTDASFHALGRILSIVPLVIPGIAVSLGWVLLASPGSGFLAHWLEMIPVLGAVLPSIFSWGGLLFVFTLTLVPYSYLILQQAFKNLDPSLEEASLVSGASTLRTLRKVTLPALRPALISAILLSAIVGVGEYAVAVVIGTTAGIDVLSVQAVRFVTADYPPQLAKAAAVGLVLLIVTLGLWLVNLRVAGAGRHARLATSRNPAAVIKLGAWRPVMRAFTIIYILCATVLPFAALGLVSLQPYWRPTIDVATLSLNNFQSMLANPLLRESVVNSVTFALIGSAITTLLVTVLVVARKLRLGRLATVGLGVVKIPAVITNVVLGLALVIAFYGAPFSLGGSPVLLILGYVLITLPFASIIAEAAMDQVSDSLVEAALISGASKITVAVRVLVPLVAPSLLSAYGLIFTMMAAEVSVSQMLAGPGLTVMGFAMINSFQSGTYSDLASIAVVVAVINLVVLSASTILGRSLRRHW